MAPPLSASQIAAQTAMHVQQSQHMRKRSQTIPDPSQTGGRNGSPAPGLPSVPALTIQHTGGSNSSSNNTMQYQNGIVGGHRMAATQAATTAFPLRSPKEEIPEKDGKEKKEKRKLFSKPKAIGIIKDRDSDKKYGALPSPGRMPNMGRFVNASTTSLVDPPLSSASTFYSTANTSTSTLVPIDRASTFTVDEKPGKEKEKHKHHFLSRQKAKLKDRDDSHHHLALSSANSTSRPTDPSAPQPLYSFAAPSSPGHSSTFAKSMSGLDLRHGGRALREKKKEEKELQKAAAAASTLAPTISHPSLEPPSSVSEWPTTSPHPSHAASPLFQPEIPTSSLSSLGQIFGLPGMGPDDAWPLLKARLLNIFEGEDPRPPIEDFNSLLSVHIRRCIQRHAPSILVEDLQELLSTGFRSLDQTLRGIPDERLVPALVEMWAVVFCTILPFLQAVFLPLDLEFKGRGPLLTAREAAEFWGAVERPEDAELLTGGGGKGGMRAVPTLGEELDVRRITLITFRDTVILPRKDALMAIFSRLSLENVDTALSDPAALEVGNASATSTTSTLATTAASSSLPSSRSRATSNTSAGSFSSRPGTSHAPQPPQQGGAGERLTEVVGRMLQCVSVLASVQSGDDAQKMVERLCGEIKLNWLGRGRVGRQRRGFVGRKVVGALRA